MKIEYVRNYEKKLIMKSFILLTCIEYVLQCPLVEVFLTLLTDLIFEGVEIEIFVVSHWLCLHCNAFAFQISRTAFFALSCCK